MTGAGGEKIVCARVLIADDQPRARRSLRALLTALRWSSPSHVDLPAPKVFFPVEVVGEAEDGPQVIELVRELRPDVVVMDLQRHAMTAAEPKLNGMATIEVLKRMWPEIRIVVLTMYATDRSSVLAAGADAFLLKGCPTRELLGAVVPDLVGPLG